MSKIKRIFVFLAAFFLPACCWLCIGILHDNDNLGSILPTLTNLINTMPWQMQRDFSLHPGLTTSFYVLYLLACIFWFARPSRLSALPMFVMSFFTGRFLSATLWVLTGMRGIAS